MKFEIVTSYVSAPDEKSSHRGHKGADAKTSLSLAIIRYSALPLVCYTPGAENWNQPLVKKNPGHASENV